MPIVGFNFERVLGEKKNVITKEVKIQNNASITDIIEEKLPIEGSKGEVLKFLFEYNTSYEPEIGEINLKGNILYLDDSKKIKEILKSWKKDKKIPQDLMEQLLNTIIRRSSIRALTLSEELNLPPQIPLPKLTPLKPEDKEYIG